MSRDTSHLPNCPWHEGRPDSDCTCAKKAVTVKMSQLTGPKILSWTDEQFLNTQMDLQDLMVDYERIKSGSNFQILNTNKGDVLVIYQGEGTPDQLLAAYEQVVSTEQPSTWSGEE